jgi:hypothetical protein
MSYLYLAVKENFDYILSLKIKNLWISLCSPRKKVYENLTLGHLITFHF